MSTGTQLIDAAAELLDSGGESAVTLRAVAQAVGVSHNAPYRHFKDRAALLAAVAERDLAMLTERFDAICECEIPPLSQLKDALGALIIYSESYPARYRLLFSNPDVASRGGELEAAAMRAFTAFARIIASAQAKGDLPNLSTPTLTGLIYATVHGLIDLQAGGRLKQAKGLTNVEQGVDALLDVITRR